MAHQNIRLGKSGKLFWATLKLQRVNAAYCTCKTRVHKSESSKPPCCISVYLDACTRIAFLNQWVFDVILSSIQLSENLKVSNGGLIIRKISVKIYKCLFEMKPWNFGHLIVQLHSFEIQRKSRIDFGRSSTLSACTKLRREFRVRKIQNILHANFFMFILLIKAASAISLFEKLTSAN